MLRKSYVFLINSVIVERSRLRLPLHCQCCKARSNYYVVVEMTACFCNDAVPNGVRVHLRKHQISVEDGADSRTTAGMLNAVQPFFSWPIQSALGNECLHQSAFSSRHVRTKFCQRESSSSASIYPSRSPRDGCQDHQ
jgi:hypothetical protein